MQKKLLSFLFAVFLINSLAGQTSIPGLTHSRLDNGLEVFTVENHTVPLTRIQITFRCGAISQQPETAGLFHLYEHMLFKGNAVYNSDSEFQSAMKTLGVTSWNGGTNTEYVTYYFTVPSDKVEEGISFWANAILYPLFRSDELQTEKQVVINEIQGALNEPGRIKNAGITRHLFYKYPWRRDVAGYVSAIESADRQKMLEIKQRYYIPNSAAVFVGGDIDPAQIRTIIDKHFGGWEPGPDPWKNPPPMQPLLENNVFLTFADRSMYEQLAFHEIRFRGPDTAHDEAATHAADMWLMLLDNPDSNFKKRIMTEVPDVYKKEHINAGYYTQKDGSFIIFSCYFIMNPDTDITDSVNAFRQTVLDEMNSIQSKDDYFSRDDYSLVKQIMADELLLTMETPAGFIENLSFWWASAGSDYYFNYRDNLADVTIEDIQDYIGTYIMDIGFVSTLTYNPVHSPVLEDGILPESWIRINENNAFWWKHPEQYTGVSNE